MHRYTRFDAQSLKDVMICTMYSIGKYMLEIILHQQRTPHLLKQKKLMQTQEDHSNPIRALIVDSLKVDSAFMSLFVQDADTFTSTMLLNVDLLQKQLDKDEFQEDGSMTAFWGGIESEVQDDNSRLGNDTDADDADIRPIYDKEPMATVQLTTESNIFAIGQQHTEQPEIINEEQPTSLLANNGALKAQILEMVFVIAALKNDLRKLKGNSIDTKFANTSVLGKPVVQPLRNQSVVRQLITQHYLPKKSESNFAKPDHMIASSSSRNSSKNMPRFSSNDMVHNHYLDEAKKKTQERDRKAKTSVMTPVRFQSTADDSKPKPRSTNHSSRSLPMSKSSCVTITAMPKADHSKSPRHMFFPNKTSVVYEKISPRSDLRWKPTGKLFDSCTSNVESEPPHGSNIDISKIHECKQTLDLSAGTSINVSKEQSLDVCAEVPSTDTIVMTSMIELESLFDPSFDEYFDGENRVVSKPFAVTTADTSDKRQQQPDLTSSTSSLATTVTANGNFDL
nr:hypothetical protein [Tanacetum cinerariifolium]